MRRSHSTLHSPLFRAPASSASVSPPERAVASGENNIGGASSWVRGDAERANQTVARKESCACGATPPTHARVSQRVQAGRRAGGHPLHPALEIGSKLFTGEINCWGAFFLLVFFPCPSSQPSEGSIKRSIRERRGGWGRKKGILTLLSPFTNWHDEVELGANGRP